MDLSFADSIAKAFNANSLFNFVSYTFTIHDENKKMKFLAVFVRVYLIEIPLCFRPRVVSFLSLLLVLAMRGEPREATSF